MVLTMIIVQMWLLVLLIITILVTCTTYVTAFQQSTSTTNYILAIGSSSSISSSRTIIQQQHQQQYTIRPNRIRTRTLSSVQTFLTLHPTGSNNQQKQRLFVPNVRFLLQQQTKNTQPQLRVISKQTTSLLFLSIWPPGGKKKNKKEQEQQENDEQSSSSILATTDSVVYESSKSLQRASFVSWWSQIILTTISAIILLFARSVGMAASGGNIGRRWYSPRYFISGIGLILSTISILWTWGNGTRLSQRLIHPTKSVSRIKAAIMLRKSITVGITINIIGLLFNLIAAEEIVGTLAMKVLTMTPYGAIGAAASTSAMLSAVESTLQPLDILVVQANTNALVSHFISLVCNLYVTNSISKLDPPSTIDNPRGL